MFPEILNEISEIMVTKVVTIKPAGTLAEAAKAMKARNVGSIVVLAGGKVVGILTERDFVKAAAEGRDPKQTTVREVMSSPVVTCMPSTRIEEAYSLMRRKRISTYL